jgi:hypothetical protein
VLQILVVPEGVVVDSQLLATGLARIHATLRLGHSSLTFLLAGAADVIPTTPIEMFPRWIRHWRVLPPSLQGWRGCTPNYFCFTRFVFIGVVLERRQNFCWPWAIWFRLILLVFIVVALHRQNCRQAFFFDAGCWVR